MMLAVEMDGLSFSYSQGPARQVLSGLSLKIRKGEFVGLIGRTGCGKSTLLLTLNGIIPQMVKGEFSGTVKVFGKDASSTPVHELARFVAIVFQDPEDQIFSLRVIDEVLFGLSNIGVAGQDAETRAASALKTVGLEDYRDSDPHLLSHGQKQKLAFACALAVDPEIFVLDEPVSSLDHASSEEIYSMLKKLNQQGKTIIVSEHDTEWLAEFASRVLLLDLGRISLDGDRGALLDKRIREAGIKVPCAAEVSLGLGKKFLTPSELSRHLGKKG